jgi:phosphotransferase system HPr-like phosphotransfer protein
MSEINIGRKEKRPATKIVKLITRYQSENILAITKAHEAES